MPVSPFTTIFSKRESAMIFRIDAEQEPHDARAAAHDLVRGLRLAAAVGRQRGLLGENREQRVAVPRSIARMNHSTSRSRAAALTCTRGRSSRTRRRARLTICRHATSLLPRLRDLVVVRVEDLVQQECRALLGSEPLEQREERHGQIRRELGRRVGGGRLLDERLGQPRPDVGSRAPRAVGAAGRCRAESWSSRAKPPACGSPPARAVPAQIGFLHHSSASAREPSMR